MALTEDSVCDFDCGGHGYTMKVGGVEVDGRGEETVELILI